MHSLAPVRSALSGLLLRKMELPFLRSATRTLDLSLIATCKPAAVSETAQVPDANPLKDAHAAVDAAVLNAHGFSARKDLLAQLLALNQQVAAKIEKGEPVTAPGVPGNYPDAKTLLTEDCIRP